MEDHLSKEAINNDKLPHGRSSLGQCILTLLLDLKSLYSTEVHFKTLILIGWIRVSLGLI